MSPVSERATVWAFRAGWSLVRRVPARVAYAAFDLVAEVTRRRGGRGVQRLRANYATVRPELDTAALERLVAAGLRSYLRYWCDVFRLPDRTPAEIRRGVRVVGDGPVRTELAGGRALVCFLGHLGNWDTAGAWGCLELGPVTTVVERLRPEELFDEFLAFRQGLGITVHPLTDGGDVFGALLRAASGGPQIIPLLADRDLTRRGIEVELCGSRARVAAGPAALALAAKAALFPVMLHSEPVPRRVHPSGRRVVIAFGDPVADPGTGTARERAATMTQACADVLGAAVRAHTQDWHMMQRVFVHDLAPGADGRSRDAGATGGAHCGGRSTPTAREG